MMVRVEVDDYGILLDPVLVSYMTSRFIFDRKFVGVALGISNNGEDTGEKFYIEGLSYLPLRRDVSEFANVDEAFAYLCKEEDIPEEDDIRRDARKNFVHIKGFGYM